MDVEGDFLYWTDETHKRIERANLDGTNQTRLLEGLDKPRALILYKAKRFVALLVRNILLRPYIITKSIASDWLNKIFLINS